MSNIPIHAEDHAPDGPDPLGQLTHLAYFSYGLYGGTPGSGQEITTPDEWVDIQFSKTFTQNLDFYPDKFANSLPSAGDKRAVNLDDGIEELAPGTDFTFVETYEDNQLWTYWQLSLEVTWYFGNVVANLDPPELLNEDQLVAARIFQAGGFLPILQGYRDVRRFRLAGGDGLFVGGSVSIEAGEGMGDRLINRCAGFVDTGYGEWPARFDNPSVDPIKCQVLHSLDWDTDGDPPKLVDALFTGHRLYRRVSPLYT